MLRLFFLLKWRWVPVALPTVFMLLAAWFFSSHILHKNRENLLIERVKLASEAVNRKLERLYTIVSFCANSPHLVQTYNLALFYEECGRLADTADAWVVLVELGPTQTQAVNTKLPLGTPPYTYNRSQEFDVLVEIETRSRATGTPMIADMFASPIGDWNIVTAGQFVKTLSGKETMVYAGVKSSQLSEMLATIGSDASGSVLITDGRTQIVSHTSFDTPPETNDLKKWASALPNTTQTTAISGVPTKLADNTNGQFDMAFQSLDLAPDWKVITIAPHPHSFAALQTSLLPMSLICIGILVSLGLLTILSRRDLAIRKIEKATRAQASAEAQSHAKSKLLAVLAHDIRTPMISLLGSLELKENANDRATKRAVETAQQLLQMLDDILELSFLGSGKLKLLPQPLDLKAFIQDLLAQFQVLADAKGLELFGEITTNLPDGVMVDKMRLHQILSNLLSNAVKYTKTGHIRLSLSCTPSDHGTAVLSFAVSDTGIGITKDAQPLIFAEFGALERTGTAGEKSTGLGLAICKRLLAAMGSKLIVESSPGEGSEFSFDLNVQCKDIAGHATAVDLQGMRILLAEDEEIIRKITVQKLEHAGALVFPARNGSEVLKIIKGVKPDVVLLDLEMPFVDGVQCVLALRGPDVNFQGPIFILTSHVSGPKSAQARQAGATEIFTKPLQLDTISAVISAHRGGHGKNAPAPDILEHEPNPAVPLLNRDTFLSLANSAIEETRTKYLPEFRIGLENAAQRLQAMIETSCYFPGWELAHGQKGVSMTFGTERLTHQLMQIENALTEEDTKALHSLLQALPALIEDSCAAMAAVLDELDGHPQAPENT